MPPSPPWHRSGDWLWDLFWAMDRARQSSDGQPQPLAPGFIRDWLEMDGLALAHEELRALRGMDNAWLDAYAAERACEWRPKPSKR